MFSAPDPRPTPGSGSFAVPERVASCEDARVIRAVLFDADGVLQGALPGWKERLAELVPADRADEFVTEVFAAELPPLRGESSWPDELAKVLARWNVTAPLDDVLANWNAIEVYPGELDVVRAVRAAGTGVYLATNQQAYRAAYMRANAGYDAIFDAEFYSCDLGLAKPDPAYFATILAAIGTPGTDALFIDDNLLNVEGARTAGLHAEHFPPGSGPTALREVLSRYDVPLA
jgi:putative hydrolase of the HAD superfamily